MSTPRAAPAATLAAPRPPEPRPGYFGAGPGRPGQTRDRTAVPGRGCRTPPVRAAAARPTRARRPRAAPPADRRRAPPSGTCPQPARGPWPRVRAVCARCGVLAVPGTGTSGGAARGRRGAPRHRTARARAGAVELALCVGSRPRQSACKSARGRPGAGASRARGMSCARNPCPRRPRGGAGRRRAGGVAVMRRGRRAAALDGSGRGVGRQRPRACSGRSWRPCGARNRCPRACQLSLRRPAGCRRSVCGALQLLAAPPSLDAVRAVPPRAQVPPSPNGTPSASSLGGLET